MRAFALLLCLACAAPAAAVEYRSIADNGTVMYDAPSLKAKPLYVASRYYPVEVLVNLEAWIKVRDQAGDLAWVEKKALTDQRTVVVTAPLADVRQRASDDAPLVFQAEQGVALEVTEQDAAGWIGVRHADGQSGFVRVGQVWGF